MAAVSFADTIRVTTWNLQTGATIPEEKLTTETGAALRQLDADVILLQGVESRQQCERIARALAPAQYKVVICSSFMPVTTPASEQPQMAILSRQSAYLSWSEPWQAPAEMRIPAGYAFAAVQAGEHRVGFFAGEFGDRQLPAVTAQQILDQLDRAKHWETNQVEAFVLGCTFSTVSKSTSVVQEKLFHFLGVGGFVDVLAGVPAEERITTASTGGRPGSVADFVLVNGPLISAKTEITPSSVLEHYPITCVLEVTSGGGLAKVQSDQNEETDSNEMRRPKETARTEGLRGFISAMMRIGNEKPLLWPTILAGTILVLGVLIYLRKYQIVLITSRSTKEVPGKTRNNQESTAAPCTVIVAAQSTTASPGQTKPLASARQVIQIEPSNSTGTQSAQRPKRCMGQEEQAEQASRLLRESLVSQLTLWLKQKLVRKLLVDRAELLAAQEQATRKALNVDARLTRLEQQIQRQNQAYERRIEELNRQLLAAKEESRELIRARIIQVKAEMETARMRLLARAEEKD